MLKHIIALVLASALYSGALACDSCSGTSMNSLDGQLLPSTKTFIGYSSSYVHQIDATKQRINSASFGLFAAYSFAKNWQVLASVPVQLSVINRSKTSNQSQIGLGDASVLLSFKAFSTSPKKEAKSKSTLILRSGLKFPTGYYDDLNQVTSNLGTKSWDLLFSTQYIFERNKQGVNLSANAQVSTVNPFSYKFGNRFNLSSFYFVKRELKKQAYMPFVGVNGEWIGVDQSNGYKRELTGGKALYGLGGFVWKWNEKISIYAKGELPIVQDYMSQDGEIYANIRAQLQLTYFIKQKTKPSKKVKL